MAHLPPSAPKWEFLLALGLDKDVRAHQDLYSSMKVPCFKIAFWPDVLTVERQTETVRVYDAQLGGNRRALKPECANAAAPFAFSQFTDIATRNAVESIYHSAGARTRSIYDRAQPGGDNWIVRWLLYHVCRYRDLRNKKARSKSFNDDDDLDGHTGPPSKSHGAGSAKARTAYYDAARDGFRS